MNLSRRDRQRFGSQVLAPGGTSHPTQGPNELELAALKERDTYVAVRAGMPPVGATATSRAGIIWKVDGHTHASSLTTQGQENNELTLYPVVFPQNLSPKLTEFLMEVGRCTPKAIMPLDTLPHQFPKRAHPGGHSVDSISDPYRILLFLDGSDVSEAIIAHELAHVWIELVRGIEDYRVMRDTSDSGRYSQVQFLQSFVLDVAVDTVLQENGFDTLDIAVDKQAALKQMGEAAKRGYHPPTNREAVYMASFLASSMLEQSLSNLLCSQTSAMVESKLPDVFRLASIFRDAVRDNPPTCAENARKAIDKVLHASFDYTDGGIDLASELFEYKPEPCWDHDKFPEWLPGLSVRGKCEVGIAMARHGIKPEDGLLFQRQEDGRITLRFRTPDGDFTPYVELEHVDVIPETPEERDRRIMEINQMQRKTYGPPSPHVARSIDAEVQRVKEMNEMNRKRMDQPQGPQLPQIPGMPQIPGPPLPPGFPPMPGRSYSPGLARFLTQVRLQELMGGEHPYGYAGNSPVTYVDPSGRAPQNPLQQYLEGMDDYFQGLLPSPQVGPPKPRFKDACDCPRQGLTSRVGQVWIDCNCKGKGIAVLPEIGPINISPPCGMWLPADGVWLVNPFPWGDSKFIKIHGQTCLVIDCSYGGRPTPLDWCCYGAANFRQCAPSIIKDPCAEFGPDRFLHGPPIVR